MPYLEAITVAIRFNDSPFAFLTLFAIAVFHAKDIFVAFFVDVFEDVLVVNLARCGFFASRVVTDLEVSDFIPGHVHVGNQIALGDLLMVQVIEDFHTGAVDTFADQIGLGDFRQKQTGMICPPV